MWMRTWTLWETFNIIVQGNQLKENLIVADDNIAAWEMFVLILAKTLRYRQSYVGMLSDFKNANIAFQNPGFPESMAIFWSIDNRDDRNFIHQVVCTLCWFVWDGKKPTSSTARVDIVLQTYRIQT